jgi:mycothiol system anti-sigma-R factor
MITCAEAVKQLWDYLDGTLADNDRAAIEEHLSFCRRCCGEVEFGEELRGFLSQHAAEEVPFEVRQRLTEVLDQLEAQ